MDGLTIGIEFPPSYFSPPTLHICGGIYLKLIMIEARELRLNNYVYGLTDRIETIQGIGKMLLTKTGKLETLFSVECADVNPIPLDEQWLLDLTEQGEPLCFEKWNDNAWEFYTTTGDFIVNPERIKYVHLFQNWFYFTTGTELTLKTEGK